MGEAEWKVLLGPDMMPLRWKEGGGHLGVFPGYSLEAVEGKAMEGGGEETGAEVNGEGVVEDFFARFGGATEVDGEEGGPEERAVEMEAEEGEGEWPTLREGDGGQEVHRMQLALR